MQEIPLIPWWLTVSLAIWASLGPLVGILVAHFLLRGWQRRQWVADNKLKEYKELMTSITECFSELMFQARHDVKSMEFTMGTSRLMISGQDTIMNRILISDKITKSGIGKNWLDAAKAFVRNRDPTALGNEYSKIRDKIQDMAKEDLVM